MTTLQAVALIAVMALVTFLTRVLPFLLFGRGGTPPASSSTWAHTCLRRSSRCSLCTACATSPLPSQRLGPALIASVAVAVVHIWKRNNMLSIVGGTLLYMVLVQFVFDVKYSRRKIFGGNICYVSLIGFC